MLPKSIIHFPLLLSQAFASSLTLDVKLVALESRNSHRKDTIFDSPENPQRYAQNSNNSSNSTTSRVCYDDILAAAASTDAISTGIFNKTNYLKFCNVLSHGYFDALPFKLIQLYNALTYQSAVLFQQNDQYFYSFTGMNITALVNASATNYQNLNFSYSTFYNDMCLKTNLTISKLITVAPTTYPIPSVFPTKRQTRKPVKPSHRPTVFPTGRPTSKPFTKSPIAHPTKTPSHHPIISPSPLTVSPTSAVAFTVSIAFTLANTAGFSALYISKSDDLVFQLQQAFQALLQHAIQYRTKTYPQRSLLRSNYTWRHLSISLRSSNSIYIVSVQDRACPPTVPSNSTCQLVVGNAALLSINENVDAARRTFLISVNQSIADGNFTLLLQPPFLATLPFSAAAKGPTTLPSGVIAGITCGAVMLGFLVMFALFINRRRRKSIQQSSL